jgi:hypothetical protein
MARRERDDKTQQDADDTPGQAADDATERTANDTPAPEDHGAAPALSIRDAILDILMRRVAQDRFPSSAMLDQIEQILTPWRYRDYVDILISKISSDRYPSRPLLCRLLRLAR